MLGTVFLFPDPVPKYREQYFLFPFPFPNAHKSFPLMPAYFSILKLELWGLEFCVMQNTLTCGCAECVSLNQIHNSLSRILGESYLSISHKVETGSKKSWRTRIRSRFYLHKILLWNVGPGNWNWKFTTCLVDSILILLVVQILQRWFFLQLIRF